MKNREPKPERISLRVPSQLLQRIERVAEMDRRSVSQVIELASELGLPALEESLGIKSPKE